MTLGSSAGVGVAPAQVRGAGHEEKNRAGQGPTLATWVSLAVCLVALILPARGTAVALVGADSAALSDVVIGAWIFKLGLLVHAGFLLASSRIRPEGSGPALAPAALGPVEPVVASGRMILVGLVCAGALIRLIDLNAGLWFDEIRTMVSYMRMPVGQIVATYDSQNQHLLYSLLARGLVGAFGESAWALRIPAVLFGVGSLAALYWFGSLVTSRREALWATALLTLSYHHLWFSQNARGYTALLFFTLVSSGLLLKQFAAREARSWAPVAGYALVMALAVFTHVTAAFIVIAHTLIWAVLLWRTRGRKSAVAWLPLAGFVLATTLTFQLYALALPQFIATLLEPTMAGVTTDWKNPIWFLAETIRGLSQGIPGGVVTLAGALAVGVAGLVSYIRQSRTVAALMLVPGILTAGAVLVMEHNLWPRFFFFCAGFAVLIAVRGMFALSTLVPWKHRTVLATVATAALVLASSITIPRAWAPKQDYAGARDYVLAMRQPTDAIVTVDLSRYPYEQYLATGWTSADSEPELHEIERGHPRTWVLYTFPARLSAVQPGIWERLQREYKTAAEFPGTVGGGAIIVKVRP